MTKAQADTKCIACGVPTLILAMTGECGTADDRVPCPHEQPDPDDWMEGEWMEVSDALKSEIREANRG